jgi:hypothetical protein
VTTVIPAVLLAAWLVAGLPLLLAGVLTPAPTIVVATVIALPALVLVAVADPSRSQSAGQGTGARRRGLPVLLTFVIAVGFAAVAWTTSSEHVIVRRDPGVYSQAADWLAHHGRLPIPTDASAFSPAAGLRYDSPGFYASNGGRDVVPQFMSGTPIALTPAGWAAGLRGITRADAVIGALALLAVAGFAGRLAGAWAAPLAALGVALAYPDLQQARSAFSEPAAQLLLFGGLALLVDAFRSRPGRTRVCLYGLAGLVIGLVVLVRIDALVELVPLVPALAVIAGCGRVREAVAAGAGVATGVAFGLVDGFAKSRPYLDSLSHELHLAAAAALGTVVITVAAYVLWRRGTFTRTSLRRYGPNAAAVAVVVVALMAYFVRPHIMHPRYAPGDPAGHDIVALQSQLGLPPSGPRTYAEQSIHWLAWWLGPTGLILGIAGAALLLRRAVRTRNDIALPFVLVVLATTAVVLAKPSITPDHPWADRRFVPVVLPGLIVAASWLIVSATRWVRARSSRTTTFVVASVGSVALVLPALLASYPLLGRSTEHGELRAVRTVCAALPPHAAVIVTGNRARDEWPQVLRGDCHVPVAVAPLDNPAAVVRAAAAAARSNGGHPVVLADSADAARSAGATDARSVVHLVTREADHQLVRRPSHTRALTVDVWLADAP